MLSVECWCEDKYICVERVDPNRVTKYGWTLLEIAAINGRSEVVRLLVNHGADINLMNVNNHFTPLENAIEGGHLDTVRVMMEDLEVPARFRGAEVADLKSAAAVVISQGGKQPISGLHVSGKSCFRRAHQPGRRSQGDHFLPPAKKQLAQTHRESDHLQDVHETMMRTVSN